MPRPGGQICQPARGIATVRPLNAKGRKRGASCLPICVRTLLKNFHDFDDQSVFDGWTDVVILAVLMIGVIALWPLVLMVTVYETTSAKHRRTIPPDQAEADKALNLTLALSFLGFVPVLFVVSTLLHAFG